MEEKEIFGFLLNALYFKRPNKTHVKTKFLPLKQKMYSHSPFCPQFKIPPSSM